MRSTNYFVSLLDELLRHTVLKRPFGYVGSYVISTLAGRFLDLVRFKTLPG